MLRIYIGLDKVPEGLKVVKDNEVAFIYTELEDTETVKSILKRVEQAEYNDNVSFIDRFGFKLYSDCLSTGTKTLLNINYQVDKVFYGGEMGYNAIAELLKLKNGNVYFDKTFDRFIEPDEGNIFVAVNGITCRNICEIEEAIYE